MMSHDELSAVLDRLGGALRSDGQAGHDPRHFSTPFTKQQADIVPLRGETRRGKALQRIEEIGNTTHDRSCSMRWGTGVEEYNARRTGAIEARLASGRVARPSLGLEILSSRLIMLIDVLSLTR